MYFDIDTHRGCFITNPDEAYFWHGQTNGCGGWNNAKDIASKNNGKTLEMCMLEHRDELENAGVKFKENDDGTVSIDYGNTRDESKQFWDECSKSFAEQSSGNVHVIEGSDLRPDGQSEKDYPSVYNRIEHPALEQNQQVNSITKIDPDSRNITGYETFDLNKKSGNAKNNENSKQNSSVASEGGGARAPNNNVRGNTDNPPKDKTPSKERGTKPALEGNARSNKETPSERGQKPLEGENKSQGNNSTPRDGRPQEVPQNTSKASQSQKGTSPSVAGDSTSKAATEQTTQNIVPKSNGMGM